MKLIKTIAAGDIVPGMWIACASFSIREVIDTYTTHNGTIYLKFPGDDITLYDCDLVDVYRTPLERVTAKVINTVTFDLRLTDGTSYHIECGRNEIDKLVELIGENHITECEEL